MPRLIAIVPAAGGGERFGADLPKQYMPLDGVPMLARTLDRLSAGIAPDRLVVSIAAGDERFGPLVGCDRPGVEVLRCGGATRAQTVRNTLAALRDSVADDDWVMVHDAARPCVPIDALARLVAALANDPVGGLLAIPAADTLKRQAPLAAATPAPRVLRTDDRAGLWQAQTPQMFRFALLARALAADERGLCTDESQAVEGLGLAPRLVEGSAANIKVTYRDDLALAAAILAAQRACGP